MRAAIRLILGGIVIVTALAMSRAHGLERGLDVIKGEIVSPTIPGRLPTSELDAPYL